MRFGYLSNQAAIFIINFFFGGGGGGGAGYFFNFENVMQHLSCNHGVLVVFKFYLKLVKSVPEKYCVFPPEKCCHPAISYK